MKKKQSRPGKKGRIRLLIWIGLAVISAALAGVMILQDGAIAREATPQFSAQRWETEEKPYAMASVFLPEERAISPDMIGEFRLATEKALVAAGTGSDTHPWIYAFSRRESATISTETASTEVELYAVAGEYFTIHPMEVLRGWYPDEEDIMDDQIVLSRQCAWDLFYSDNVVGMFVELYGARYRIAAVVDTESGERNELVAGTSPRAWVYYNGPGMSTDRGFTAVEAVLPQPVKNFAAATLRSTLSIPDSTPILDNTGRFSLISRFNVLREFSLRGISQDTVVYPYWENAARLTENTLALRLIPEAILLLFPAVSVLVWLWMLNRRRTWGLHSIRNGIEYLIDRHHVRLYNKKNAVPEEQDDPVE